MTKTIKYTKDFVSSVDGTTIGYRQLGKGPGLILVHGGMMASQNLMKLGELLANEFTIYIPDRQGRGLSQAHDKFGLDTESKDLQALVNKTKAAYVYGLSAGAIVVLQASIAEKSIKKVVLHEPPIVSRQEKAMAWANKYWAAMERENYGRAFISVVNGTDDPSSLLNVLPGIITSPLMNIAIKKEAKKIKENTDDATLKALLTAMRFDIKLIEDSEGIIERAKNVEAAILLLRGQKSQPYLRAIVDKLSAALPKAKCVDLAGQGHTVSDNGGKPALVATELRKFFTKNDAD